MSIASKIKSAIKSGLGSLGLKLSRVDGLRLRRLTEAERFHRRFLQNLKKCNWSPHPLYSVFTQYDQEFYLQKYGLFFHKYQCFWAVSKTISPKRIIELGVLAGSSSDAYMSATPTAHFTGLDQFGEGMHETEHRWWSSYEIAEKLFSERGFTRYELIKRDLRELDRCPCEADFVVVDAAHDFENEYADLQLALSASPTFIFVDDTENLEVKQAVETFLSNDVQERLEYTVPIDYYGGGLVIKLRS
jgi:hypothetical protein